MINRRRYLCLALLVGVNSLVAIIAEGGLALSSFEDSPFYWVPLYYLCDAIFTAQFLFLGFWAALASDRLIVRLVVGLSLAGVSIGIYFLFFWIAGETLPLPTDPTKDAAKYCGLGLISFLLLRALRPWRGWRLVWAGSPHLPQSRQFRILDLLIWTAAVAIPLGLLQAVYGSETEVGALALAMTFVSLLPITIPSCRWAVRPQRTYRPLIALLLWTAIWPFCLALLFIAYSYLFTGSVGPEILMGMTLQVPIWLAYYLPLVLLLTGNVLALQRIGLRTVSRTAPKGP
jgi:hypothetical protein